VLLCVIAVVVLAYLFLIFLLFGKNVFVRTPWLQDRLEQILYRCIWWITTRSIIYVAAWVRRAAPKPIPPGCGGRVGPL